MLKFNTLFPIKSDTSPDDFISIVNKWIIGSPHSNFSEDTIKKHLNSLGWEEEIDSEGLAFIRGDTENYQTFGMRYSKQEKKLRWITDIIGTKNSNEFLTSIQVSCDTTNLGEHIRESKKPYIIKQLLEQIGGGSDGDLEVKDIPYSLKNSDIDFAASLIKGLSDLNLPVIYISSGGNNLPFVNAKNLAKWFSGMAHVVVEPNREFSFRLMHEVSHRNAYGGAIGIYWPNNAGSKILLPSFFQYDKSRLEKGVSNALRNGLNTLRPPRMCTWGNLKEISARRQIDKLKKEGSTEINDYIDAFDSESMAKSEEIYDLNKEVSRLKAELQAVNQSSAVVAGGPLLAKGSEIELYPNEYREIFLSICEKSKNNIDADSRRQHILNDVLSANEPGRSIKDKVSSIKTQLKDYRTMSTKTRQFLEELGFDITEGGKHYKATFKGDDRYIVSFPKTSSDHRVGKNLASEIINLLF